MSDRSYLMKLFDVFKRYFTKAHGPFKRWGGSSRYSKRIAEILPEHKVFVETFAGAASVFFTKESAETNILNDLDKEIVHAFRMIRRADQEMVDKLKTFDPTITKEKMAHYAKNIPTDDHERLHRFLFVQSAGWSGLRTSNVVQEKIGRSAYKAERILKYKEKLQNATVTNLDYREVIKKFDGPDTLFFIDPPYPGEWPSKADDMGGPQIDLEEFCNTVKSIQGKWIVVLGDTEDQIKSTVALGNMFTMEIRESQSTGGDKVAKRYFATNIPEISKNITKGFMNGSPEGGPHAHTMLRGEAKTQNDGRHLHIFKVDEDVMLATREDGAHWHGLEDANSSKTNLDGNHSHVVVLPDGTEVTTNEDGEHEHSTMVETTNFDGNHEHALTLPDGQMIQSMTIEEFLVEFGPIEDVEIPMPPASEITGATSTEIQGQQDSGREVQAESELDKENKLILAGFGYKEQPDKQGEKKGKQSEDNIVEKKKDAKKKNLDLLVVQKSEHEKQIVYGVVLEPDSTDAHNDVISVEEIEQAAHKYMVDYRVIGEQHTKVSNAELVESFIAPVDFVWNGQQIKKGSWIIGVHVLSKEYWEKIKNGEINSFSMGGYAVRE